MSEAEAEEEEEVLSLGTSDEADMCEEPGNEEESALQVCCDSMTILVLNVTSWSWRLPFF